jgi:uncharacterized membrane protein YkoI
MSTRRKALVAGLAALAIAAGGVSVANALGGNDGGDEQANGPAAEAAKAAALQIVPGTANAVERDSEKGATWEVEVRKPDGSTVDVRLDAEYKKVAVDSDSEGADDGSDDAGE